MKEDRCPECNAPPSGLLDLHMPGCSRLVASSSVMLPPAGEERREGTTEAMPCDSNEGWSDGATRDDYVLSEHVSARSLPFVGRPVQYTTNPSDDPQDDEQIQICAAIITRVHPDGRVSLVVFPPHGGRVDLAFVPAVVGFAQPGTEAARGCWSFLPGGL